MYNPQRTTQNRQGQSKRDTGRPRLAQSAVVPSTGKGTNAETRPRVSEGKSCQQTRKQNRLRKALPLIICKVSGRDSEAPFFLRYTHPGVAVPAFFLLLLFLFFNFIFYLFVCLFVFVVVVVDYLAYRSSEILYSKKISSTASK